MTPVKKPSIQELALAVNKTVPDIIAPNLKVLFCGINPGLYTAAIGHHFGRPGNRFWPALYAAGFTPRLFSPCEDHKLLKIGYGITNIVARATNAAADLETDEFKIGKTELVNKVKKYCPKWVAFIGIGAYRTGFSKHKAAIGLQPEMIGESKVWVLPSTSGLNANYRPSELNQLFSQLKFAVDSIE